jgi:hypothetical protein
VEPLNAPGALDVMPGRRILAGVIAVTVVLLVAALVFLGPDWAPRTDLVRARNVLASGGGVEVSSDSLRPLGDLGGGSLLVTAGGRGRLELTGPHLHVVLLVNDRWWLYFPDRHYTLVGRDDLPAFDLGDAFHDKTVLPPQAPPTFDPNSLFYVAWMLPHWGRSAPAAAGWKFTPKLGKYTITGVHGADGTLSSLAVGGVIPGGELNLKVAFLAHDDCDRALATPATFTAAGTRVEEVPTLLLQKSVYGTVTLATNVLSR